MGSSQVFRGQSIILYESEMTMRFPIIILVAVLCWQTCPANVNAADANVADKAFPTNLLGFIKPGMLVGIRSSKLDSLLTISIYSEDQFRRAWDVHNMSLEELGQKYPEIADQAASALAEYKSSLEAKKLSANMRDNYAPAVSVVVDQGVLLCTVLHVGEDYLLVTYGEDNSKRKVIAKQAVAQIFWANDDVYFRTRMSPVQTQE